MATPPSPSAPGVLVALDHATARSLLEALAASLGARRASPCGEPLTPRENEVLAGLSEGKNYGQIAAELVIELETVRTHARRVRRKLGVATSRELHGCSLSTPSGSDAGRPASRRRQITP